MSLWRTYYHFVWGTKNREPLLIPDRQIIVRQSIIAIAQEFGSYVHAIGFMPEHVHLAISIPPKFAVTDFVFRAKGSSSRDVNLETTSASGQFRWQGEYGVMTFSERSLGSVRDYVENQPQRHTRNQIWPDFERVTDYTPK